MEEGIDEGKEASICAEQPPVSAIIDYVSVFRGIQAQSQAVSAGTEDDKLSQVSSGVGDKTGIYFSCHI